MSHRIAVANQKGGVGKTTLSIGIAGILSEQGKKILLVDMDQQGNLTSAFLSNIHKLPLTVCDLLVEDDVEILDVIKQTKIKNIDILPSNLSLSDLDTKLAGDDDAQYYLLEALEEIKTNYDFIIIDCPPSLGRATRMALVAAQSLILPIECQEWAVKGSSQLEAYVERVKKRANPDLKILGFVINKYDSRRAIESSYNEVLRKKYPDKIFKTEFHNNVQYTESATAKKPINYYLPKSKQAESFRKFIRELLPYVEKS